MANNTLLDRLVSTLFTKTLRRTAFPALCLAAALAFGSQNASAADIYWNAQTGKWEVAENWNVGSQTGTTHQVPTASDYVYINNGGSALVDANSPEAQANWLYVGDSGTGVLNLTGGGKATSANDIYLGYYTGSSGTVTVDGSGSLLESGYWLYVGASGTGVLNLTGGGKATSTGSILLGIYANSSGTVTVDGSGSELNGTRLLVGGSGNGVLYLSSGGQARFSSFISLGGSSWSSSGGSGTVTVGSGSMLQTTDYIHVGYDGHGLLAGTGTVSVGASNFVRIYEGSTLSAGDFSGQVGTLNVNGNLEMNDGSTLRVDLSSGGYDKIQLAAGKTATVEAINVDLTSLRTGSGMAIIAAPGTLTYTNDSATILLNGEKITDARRLSGVTVTITQSGNGQNLNLNIGGTFTNKNLTWTTDQPGTVSWVLNNRPWNDDAFEYSYFLDGDAVTFNRLGTNTVNIGGTGKTVSQMTVGGDGNWTFNGNILADASKTTLANQTGKLLVNGTGTVTLHSNPTLGAGMNRFIGGVDIQSGTLIVDSAASLGTDLNRLRFTNTGAANLAKLTIEDGKKLQFLATSGQSNQQLFVNRGTAGTIQLGTNAGLTIQNNRVANNYGSAIYIQPVSGGTAGGKLDLLTATGAEFVFSGNSGRQGGALYNGGTLNIGNAVFENNQALVSGGFGYGGAFATDNAAAVTTFTGSAVFRNNKAEQRGGAIYSSRGTTTFSQAPTFDLNTALSGGAIHVDDGIVNLQNGGTFSGNKATTATVGSANAATGGALSVAGGTVNLKDVTFSGNTVTATNATGTGYAYGGALYQSDGTVTFTGDTRFEGNRSVSAGQDYTQGGAIYYAGGTLKFNGATVFSGNHADQGGGAIYASAALDLSASTSSLTFTDNSAINGGGILAGSVTLGGKVAFIGNSANDGGGGISAGLVTLGNNIAFIGNSANYGGGIWAGSVTLGGNTLFKDNTARIDGGAICLRGYSTSTLNANTGAIAFTGNTANNAANSIYLQEYVQLTLTGSGNIYFDDPISSGSEGSEGGNSLTKSGTGFVQFAGDSVLNPSYRTGGGVTVSGGAFRVVNGASFTNGGDGSTFTVESGGMLSGGGTITAQQGFTISGTISPDADRFEIPDFDTTTNTFDAGRTEIAADKKIGTLKLNGNTTLDGATLAVDIASATSFDKIAVTGTVGYTGTTVIDLGNFLAGNYTGIVTSTDTMDALGAYDVKLNGNALSGRQAATASVVDKSLNLMLADDYNVYTTWERPANDGIGYWYNGNTTNWLDTTGADTSFKNGDFVTFGKNETRTITLTRGDVWTSGMVVTDGNYTFTTTGSGKITDTMTVIGDKVTPTGKYEQTGGNVTFNVATNFSNGYELTGGTLTVGDGGSLAGNVLNNAALTFSGTGAKTYADVISGTGTVTKSGTGTLTLSGTNTYSGNTTVFGGTLHITGLLGSGSYAGTIANSGTLAFSGGGTQTLSGAVTGSGKLTVGNGSAGHVVFSNAAKAYTGATHVGTGSTLTVNTTANQDLYGITGSGTITANAGNTVVLRNNSTFDGTLNGSGTFTKSGINTTTTLTNAAMDAGAANFTAVSGTLALTGNMTTTGNVSVANGATLGIAVNDQTTPTLAADSLLAVTGAIINVSGFAGGQTAETYLLVETDTAMTADVLAAVRIGSGSVDPTANYMTGTAAWGGAMNDDQTELVATVGLSWYNNTIAQAHGTFDIANDDVADISTALVDRTPKPFVGFGSWNGATLTKKGSGTLVLSGTNPYSGATNIEEGTLSITHADALQGTTGVVFAVANAADTKIFDLNYDSDGTFAKQITGAGTLQKSGDARVLLTGSNMFTGATVVKAGTLAVSGATALGAGVTGTSGVTVESGAVFEWAYTNTGWFQISISGDGSVLKTGDKTVTVNSSSTYTGGTEIQDGTLILTNNAAAGTGAVTIAAGKTLQLGDMQSFIGGPIFSNEIIGSGTVVIDADVTRQRHDASFTGDFYVNTSRTLTLDYTADGVFSSVISGYGDVMKTDSNRLTIAGANTNSGTFTQNAGEVRLDSNWAGNYTQNAGAFTAEDDATISGSAAFSGNVALDENLNVGSLAFAGATIAFDADNDLFTVTNGGVTFSGANTLNAAFASGVQLGTYDIAVVTGGGTVADPAGTWTYTLGSTHLDGYNLDARGSGIVRSADNKKLQLRVALDAINLTWNGTGAAGGDLWTNNPTLDTLGNWTNGGVGSLLETKFRDSDNVTFSNTAVKKDVNVGANVTTGTMTVVGATYTFAGTGGITSTSTFVLQNNADVTLANSGTNNFGGGTTINTGSTLRIGDSGTTGNLGGTIANSGTLVLNKSNTYTLNNTISGTGTVRMDGGGTAIIGGTGTSQSNAFEQSAGTVNLTQQWTGNYTQTGGVLTGDGTISGNLVSAKSVNPDGTLSVTGTANLTGTTLGIKTSDGNVSDKLAVTGAVTLGTGADMTTIDILDFRPGEYTILTASGFGTTIGNNTFTTLVGGSNLAARQSVDYTNSTGTSVVITLATLGNVALTWTGSDGDSWRSGNWTTGSATDSFADGDTVTFDTSVATPQTVYLGTGTNTVASMNVDGGDYTYIGSGGITGTNNTSDTEIPNPTGKLTVDGNASVTFANTGTNTFAGGTKITSGSTVTLGQGNASGSLGGIIDNDGTFVLNRSDSFTLTNEISGSGTTRMIGDGTATISGTNAKSNKLEQTAGTIVLAGDWTGDFEQTSGTLSGGGTLNGDATISDMIAPTGTLTLGSVTFVGDSTPGLGATINIGTLGTDMIAVNGTTTFDVSNGKIKVDLGTWTLGTGTILTDSLSGTLDIDAIFEDVTLNGQVVSGRQTADLSVLNGDLILTTSALNETRTWTGSSGNSWDKNTTESWFEGDLKFIDGDKVVFNATGALVPNVTIAENLIASEMTIDGNADYTFGGASITTDATAWSGSGTASGKLVKNGTGTAAFNNANDFKGGTDLNAGRITVGNDLALGTQTVRMASGTTLGFSGNHTISNIISLRGDATVDTGSNIAVMTGKIGGDYTLTKDGAGTLTLEAVNEHGATNIAAGRLIAKRAAALGSGNADIETGATLELDLVGEVTNSVSGSGTLENKGDIVLSGDHSLFTGTTSVLTGKTILADGFRSGSDFDVSSTLAGNGHMNGDLIVRNGATLSPGNSIGRIETGGNAIFENGAKYEVEIDIAADEADLLVAAGNVTIGDTSQLDVEVLDVANLDSATEYLVIESTGGTISRTFADEYYFEKALYGFTQDLRGGNKLYLTLHRKQSNFADFLLGLGYRNAYNAAVAVDAIDAAGESAKLGSLFDALGNLDVDADTYLAAFTQLHGEVFAASREATAQTQRRFLRNLPTARDRVLKTSCDPCGAVNSFKDWNRWATFTGDWLNRNNIGNFSGYDLRTYGVAFGMDKNVTKKMFVGAAFGYDDATQKFDTLHSRDEMDVFRSMLYGGWRSGRTYVDGYVGYTKNWHKTRRDINIGNFAGTARSKYDDDMLSTGIEIGRKLRFDRLNVTPSIGLHYIYLDSPSATETGADGANLHVSGGKYDSLRLPVGARINRDFRMVNGMTWTPELRAFYVAELADDSASVRTSFNNIRNVGFTASSGSWGRSSGVFGVGLKGQLSDRLSLRVDYDYEVYEHTDMGEFSASAGVNW